MIDARESVRDERVGGGDSLSGLRTEIRVLLVVLEHLAQFVCATREEYQNLRIVHMLARKLP